MKAIANRQKLFVKAREFKFVQQMRGRRDQRILKQFSSRLHQPAGKSRKG